MIINWVAVLLFELKEKKNKYGSVIKTIINTIIMSGLFYIGFLAMYVFIWIDFIIYMTAYKDDEYKTSESVEVEFCVKLVFWEFFYTA